MSVRTRVMFDGHELTRDYHVSDLGMPLLPRDVGTQDVPGRDGDVFTGVRLTQRTINLVLTAVAKNIEQRQAAGRRLAALLATKEPKPLQISIDDGIYYLAVPSSADDAIRYMSATSFPVEFVCPDPVAYGLERTVTVPAGGSVTFEVGGTYPARPVVSTLITEGGGTREWKLTLEDGTYLLYSSTYPSTSGIWQTQLVADCDARTLKANGATTLLVPSADWLVLTPGEHTLTLSGNAGNLSSAEVTFIERWL